MKKIIFAFMILSAGAWAQYERQQDYQESATKIDKVYIDCVIGKIYCEPAADNNVSISVKKNVFISDEKEAKRLADDCRINFNINNKTLRMTVDIPGRVLHKRLSLGSLVSGNRDGDLELLIKVFLPQGISTEIETATADIFASELKGNDLEIEGSSSDISLENMKGNCLIDVSSGDLEAKSIEGEIDITGSSSNITIDGLNGGLKISTASGDCTIEHVKGNAKINTSSGDINFINLDGDLSACSNSGDFQGENISGSVEISSSSGSINLRHLTNYEGEILTDSNSGDVYIEIPAAFKGYVELESVSGDVNSRVDLTTESRSRSRLAGSVSHGSGRIKAETTSGDIVLESY